MIKEPAFILCAACSPVKIEQRCAGGCTVGGAMRICDVIVTCPLDGSCGRGPVLGLAPKKPPLKVLSALVSRCVNMGCCPMASRAAPPSSEPKFYGYCTRNMELESVSRIGSPLWWETGRDDGDTAVRCLQTDSRDWRW